MITAIEIKKAVDAYIKEQEAITQTLQLIAKRLDDIKATIDELIDTAQRIENDLTYR